MKNFFIFFALLMTGSLAAQTPLGNQRIGRPAIPQAQGPVSKPEPKTAEELVEEEMPGIIEAVQLDPFEAAVVSSILTRHVKQRMELRILELDQDQTREALEKIELSERAELESGLPPEKYEAMISLKENRYNTKKLKKDKKKKKKKQKPE